MRLEYKSYSRKIPCWERRELLGIRIVCNEQSRYNGKISEG